MLDTWLGRVPRVGVRWRGALAGCVVACLAAGACGGDPDFDVSRTFCTSLCDRWQQCVPSFNEAACVDDCVATSRTLTYIRSEAAKPLSKCIEGLSCSELDDGVSVGQCFDTAYKELSITEASRRFCEAYAERIFRCGGYYGEPECVEDFKPWNDAALEGYTECLSEDCESFSACFDAAVEFTR